MACRSMVLEAPSNYLSIIMVDQLTFYIMDKIEMATWGIDIANALGLILDCSQHQIKSLTTYSSSMVWFEKFPQFIASGVGLYPVFQYKIILAADNQPVARGPCPVPVAG